MIHALCFDLIQADDSYIFRADGHNFFRLMVLYYSFALMVYLYLRLLPLVSIFAPETYLSG
jgi:hypothetical protein